MSGTERLTYIHSGACMDNLETDGYRAVLDELTLDTKKKAEILFATPEAQVIRDKIDFEELFTEANTAIVRSYGLLHTLANSLANSKTIRELMIADANGNISTEILEALKMRVTDLAFQALGTTRIEHFQSFLKTVKEKGSVRVGKLAQLQYIDEEYILKAVSEKRNQHRQVDFGGNLLATVPRKCATVIKLW